MDLRYMRVRFVLACRCLSKHCSSYKALFESHPHCVGCGFLMIKLKDLDNMGYGL